ncbi:DEAD/DEAH box helicase [Desulfonatronum thiodismutans]|uniref:DEAD/DEAH box helicase n=1 Tax=Desulfonatronum thiodismutans TaxID=159290 RepID=UPI0004ABEDD0|nr:DEAD/DEAH box helicase [Desulfonatronum thiodismutans]
MTTVTISSQTHLENIPASALERIKQSLTMRNPAHAEAVKHGRWTGKIPQELRFYENTLDGLTIPRGFTDQALTILAGQNCPAAVVDHRLTLPDMDLTFQGKLRPYQTEAVAAVLGRDHGVLEASTGSGKTVMGLAVIGARKQPTLVLVHNKELLNQWADRIRQFLGIEAGFIGDGKFDVRPVTVGIVNTVRRRLPDLIGKFGQVVVDECHRAPAAMFSECVKEFPAKNLLGLSATPFRRDGLDKLIFFAMGDLAHKVDPGKLVECGAVLEPTIVVSETEFFYSYADDYAAMVTALVEDTERNVQIIHDVVTFTKGNGTSLLVSDRVSHCEELAEGIRHRGLAVEVLTGGTRAQDRARIVADVQAGRVQVLVSTMSLISEGFDCPGLDLLFLATPVAYRGRLMQVVGRILRPAPGKTPYVIDYVDHRVPVLRHQAKKRWE